MTESTQVWAVARRYLAPYGFLARIESRIELGVPDVHYVLRGIVGWWESKLFEIEGRAPSHLTREQVMWGETYVAAGGRWHLLGRAGPVWLLYDAFAARSLFE